jgi:flavin-binding protein dodecin
MLKQRSKAMAEHSFYKVIELVGTSPISWEDAAKSAVLAASQTLRNLRVAEIKQFDLKIEGGSVVYRAKLDVSFKVEGHEL